MIPTCSPDECGVPAQELLLFASGQSRGAGRRQILEHLLAGCVRCRETLAALKDLGTERPGAAGSEESEDAASVSKILASLGQRAERIEKERAQARLYLTDFLAHPALRQWTLIRNSKRFDTWSFGAGLLEAAFEAIYDDPRRSLDLALMAQCVVERLEVEPYGQRSVCDLQARAFAHVGNARRALGDLTGASEALKRARQLLADGTGDPLEEAELLYYEASLLRGLRRLDEALRKVRRSARLYRELGDVHLEGRSMVNEANILSLRGEAARSLELLVVAAAKVDPERDPRLALGVRHNQVWHLMELGRTAEALDALQTFRGDYESLGDRTSLLRLGWLQARLFQKLGRREEAAAQFRAARGRLHRARAAVRNGDRDARLRAPARRGEPVPRGEGAGGGDAGAVPLDRRGARVDRRLDGLPAGGRSRGRDRGAARTARPVLHRGQAAPGVAVRSLTPAL